MDLRVALAAGSAVLLAACGAVSTPTANEPPRSPSASPATTGVVPWADLPPAYERLPTHVVPARPDVTLAAEAPPCAAGQVRIQDAGADGAGGTFYDAIAIRLASGPPCSVQGTPTARFTTPGTSLETTRSGVTMSGFRGGPVLLTRSESAVTTLTWSDVICAWRPGRPVPSSTALTLTFDSGVAATTPLTGRSRQRSCWLDADHGGPDRLQPVGVGPVSPRDYRPAVVTTDWSSVRADPGWLRLRAAPGADLVFGVTLTARQDVSLATCPDYVLDLFGYDVKQVDQHQLDCAGVPYRDSSGTPYLPAGVPVTFEMRTVAPARPAQKVVWMLSPRSNPASAGGPVAAGSFTPVG